MYLKFVAYIEKTSFLYVVRNDITNFIVASTQFELSIVKFVVSYFFPFSLTATLPFTLTARWLFYNQKLHIFGGRKNIPLALNFVDFNLEFVLTRFDIQSI